MIDFLLEIVLFAMRAIPVVIVLVLFGAPLWAALAAGLVVAQISEKHDIGHGGDDDDHIFIYPPGKGQ